MQKILFFNITWMDFYDGFAECHGGGEFVEKNGYAHEMFNFKNINEKVYGYVRPVREKVNLERLGAEKGAESLTDVLIIFTARRKDFGRVIVGWYKNATVFRECQNDRMKERKYNDEFFGYYTFAELKDAVLLKKDERTFRMQTGKDGMGQSNVWYADADNVSEFKKEVLEFINIYERKHTKKSKVQIVK